MQRIITVLLLVLAVTAFNVTARAAVDSTDILIKALIEKQVITEEDAAAVRAEIANIRQDEEAARKSFPVSAKRPIKVSGYAQLRYINAEGANTHSTLEARRIRLTLSGDATPDVDYRLQFDFAGSRKGVIDNTFKTAVFGKPVLLDAVIGYRLPWDDKVILGQQKVPFGLEQLTSSANLDTINVSQVTEALTPGYDTGAQYTGTHPLGGTQVEYAAGIFTGAGINTGDDNEHKDLAARVVWKPAVPGLAIGGDFYDGAAGTQRTKRDRAGFDVTYARKQWAFRGEHLWGTDADVKKRGWYVTAVRTLTPTLQAVVRLDRFDPNTATVNDVTNTLTGGVNWFLSGDGLTRIQVNYERKHEQGTQVPNNQLLAQFQAGF